MTTLINLLSWRPGFSGFGSYVQRVIPGVPGMSLQVNDVGEPVVLMPDQWGTTVPGWSQSWKMRSLQRAGLLQHGLNLDALLHSHGKTFDKFEVIYSPLFDALLNSPQIPQLITCHDLTPLVKANSRKAWLLYRFWQPRHVRAASRLIAISGYVADQLLRYGAIADRLVVIPNGVQIVRSRVTEPRTENLLVIARHDRNKNLLGLLRCVAYAQRMLPHWNGIVTIVGRGGTQHSKFIQKACSELPRPEKVRLCANLSQEILIDLMRNSLALVSASTEEGFDYPILEAKAEGIPTLISNILVHLEFHSESSLFFPVDDDGSIFSSQLRRLLIDRSAWAELSTRGYELASQMSVANQQAAIREQISTMS